MEMSLEDAGRVQGSSPLHSSPPAPTPHGSWRLKSSPTRSSSPPDKTQRYSEAPPLRSLALTSLSVFAQSEKVKDLSLLESCVLQSSRPLPRSQTVPKLSRNTVCVSFWDRLPSSLPRDDALKRLLRNVFRNPVPLHCQVALRQDVAYDPIVMTSDATRMHVRRLMDRRNDAIPPGTEVSPSMSLAALDAP